MDCTVNPAGPRRAFSVISIGALGAKVLGAVREMLMAAVWGQGAVVGAFLVCLNALLVPVSLAVGELLQGAFIPVYARHRRCGSRLAPISLWMGLIVWSLVAVLIAVLLVVAGDWLVRLLAPGIGVEARDLAVRFMFAIAFGAVPFVVTAVLAVVAVQHGRPLGAALRPGVQSLGVIAGIGAAVAFNDPVYLGVGFAGAYALNATGLLVLCPINNCKS